MKDIPGYNSFVAIEEINRGWSKDRKYKVTVDDGSILFLRISPLEKYDFLKKIYEFQNKVFALGVPMCEPLDYGLCAEGVYSFYRWIEGKDLIDVLTEYALDKQYYLGKEAGVILKTIHTITPSDILEDWETRFNRKIDRNIKMHNDCAIQFRGAEHIINYINENRHLLKNRPQYYCHGDYHVGNMMIEDDKLVIIDFDRLDFGDPWEEFNRIVWCAQISPCFASGMIDGYFGEEPSEDTWRLLTLYISSNILSSVPWAIPFGEKDVNVMLNLASDVLSWYDNMNTYIPSWYMRGIFELEN